MTYRCKAYLKCQKIIVKELFVYIHDQFLASKEVRVVMWFESGVLYWQPGFNSRPGNRQKKRHEIAPKCAFN